MALVPQSERLKDDRYALQKAIRDVEDSNTWHDKFVTTLENRHKAYRGVLERHDDAAKWTSKLHPAILFQVVETITANLLEDSLKFRCRPRLRPDSTPDDHQKQIKGAAALEALLAYDNDIDRLNEKQRPIILEACIAGLAVGKVTYDYRFTTFTTEKQEMEAVHDEVGNLAGYIPVWKPSEETKVLRDGTRFEPVDLRDFFWDESAKSIESSRWCAHRVWMTLDELLHLQKLGIYKGVDQLDDAEQTERISEMSMEDQLIDRNRTRGLYEVIEYWTNDRVVVVIDRRILARNDANPFDHGCKPFVEFSTMPQPFQVGGTSDVELTKPLQDATWLMLNQRIDNVNLLNNSIILMRSDVDDPDDFEFGPGERWLVDDIQQVTTLQMNDAPAQISLESEKLIRGDIMDITGGMPFSSGQPEAMDGQTATGASIVQTVAQRRLMARKQQLMYSWRRVGQLKAELLQQFTTEARFIPILGQQGAQDLEAILPEQLQGEFDVIIDPIAESLMRQERRSEAQAMFQAAVQAAPVLQATGSPLNLEAFVKHWLEAYDITDPESYLGAPPQPQMPPMGGPGGPAGQNMQGSAPNPQNAIPPIMPPQGVTNPHLAAGALAPSSQVSMAPVASLQQQLARAGGGRSV